MLILKCIYKIYIIKKKVGIIMKKSKLLGMGVALGAALCSTALLSSSVNADVYNWVANTPSQIAPLNNNGTYTVRKGDTLWAIGMHYNIKPWSIAQWNNITDPYTLQIGTVLKLNVSDNGNKATLTIQNGNTTKKIPLTNNDKWDQNKSFGTQLNSNDKAVQQTQTTTNNVNNKANTTVKNNSAVQNNTQNKVSANSNSKADTTTKSSSVAQNNTQNKVAVNTNSQKINSNTNNNSCLKAALSIHTGAVYATFTNIGKNPLTINNNEFQLSLNTHISPIGGAEAFNITLAPGESKTLPLTITMEMFGKQEATLYQNGKVIASATAQMPTAQQLTNNQ